MMKLTKEIGVFCRLYRYHVLQLTLHEMSDKTETKVSTLSSFENGRSSNFNHVLTYYNLGNDEQKEFFRNNLPLEIGGVDYGN